MVIFCIGVFESLRLELMPPMTPMVSISGSLLEGVSRLAPLSDCFLPGQDEPSNARPGEVRQAHSEVLPTASLGVYELLHKRIELADSYRQIPMFLPPENEQVADLLAAPIACLRFADPLNWVLTTEREQWVANPAAPLFKAAELDAFLDVGCKPTPPPDSEQRSQEFGTAFANLRTDVVLERSSLRRSSVRGSNSTATKRRARSSDTLRPLPVMITKEDAFNCTICDLPSSLTRAGRSVMALARRSERNAVLLRLSRNSAGLPPINSAAIRFSSSSAVAPAVTA